MPVGSHDSPGGYIATQDSAEDVHQHPSHLGVGKDDAHGAGHLFVVGPAAHVKEIGWSRSGGGGGVQRGHGQTGAVYQTSHVAVQVHISNVQIGRLSLQLVLLRCVAQPPEVRVPEHGVVVQADLGIQGHQAAIPGHYQWVDLHQGAVVVHENFIECAQYLRGGAGQRRVQPQPGRQPPCLVRHEPQHRVDGLGMDVIRVGGCHPFDIHAARGAGQHDRDSFHPVHGEGQVKLLADIGQLFHQYLVHRGPFRPRLVGHQVGFQHPQGLGFGVVG